MTDTIKVLGQLDAAATTQEVLYTAPSLSQVTTSTLAVCNRTTGSLSFRISIHVAGEALDNKQYIFYDTDVGAKSTLVAILGLTLQEADEIQTYASATGLSFSVFGVETT